MIETRLARARQNALLELCGDFSLKYINIRSLQVLKVYEEHSRRGYPEEQRPRIVEIQLYDRVEQPVRRVSNLLFQTPSIATLKLDFYPLSKFKGNRLFQGITLHHLQILSCSGIHHATLAHFIVRHPNLRSLSTGKCSEGTCALSTLSIQLNLSVISGPPSCISGLVSRMTEQIFVTCRDPNDNKDLLFSQVKAVRAPIQLFSTQFFPGDLEFMHRLHDAMPNVSILRLKEAPTHRAKKAVSYPWNHSAGTWNAGMHNMRSLKSLDVQTISPPILGMPPGEAMAELGLIRMWVDKKMGDLTEVNIWYSCEGVSYQSSWVRSRGSKTWTRESHCEVQRRECVW